MPKYIVKELQEVTRFRAWTWTVEAATEAEAIALAQDGEGELCDDGGQNIGEEGYGDSGWAAAEDEAAHNRDLIDEAFANLDKLELPTPIV